MLSEPRDYKSIPLFANATDSEWPAERRWHVGANADSPQKYDFVLQIVAE